MQLLEVLIIHDGPAPLMEHHLAKTEPSREREQTIEHGITLEEPKAISAKS